MNAKLLFKTIFFLAILLLLVLMGRYNPGSVTFWLPPLVPKLSQPAAIMYYAFFAIGFLTATVLMAGGGSKGSGGGSSKPKPKKD